MLVGSTNGKLHQSREEISNTKAKELWQEMRQGSPAAFELLFRAYYADLYDFGIKTIHSGEIVTDALQELFIYIWQKKEKLKDVNSVRAYLLTSLRNKLVNIYKKQQTLLNKNELWQQEQTAFVFSTEEKQIDMETEQENKKRLIKAMDGISAREREALYLKTYQNCSYNEIAKIMQVNGQVARNYVCQALKKLRKQFTEKII